MARQIVLSLNGKVSRFGFLKLSRDKLYGRKKRIVVDHEKGACSSGMLPVEGDVVLPPRSTTNLYANDEFEQFARSELFAIGPDDEPLEKLPSTLDLEQALDGPVSPQRILDHAINNTYLLDPEELDDELRAGLDRGDIYESRFNYYADYDDSAMFLLKNDEGYFALMGEPTRFELCLPSQPALLPEADDEGLLEDDLDFSML